MSKINHIVMLIFLPAIPKNLDIKASKIPKAAKEPRNEKRLKISQNELCQNEGKGDFITRIESGEQNITTKH